jgi:hypothetical protein
MWEQRESLKSRMFGKSADHLFGTSSGPSSSSAPGASKKASAAGANRDKMTAGFVSRLGFKFDVANYDINAISPTSW